MSRSLKGRKILLTREKGPSLLMAHDILALGGEPVIAPVMKIVTSELTPFELKTIKEANRFDWIIFTSSNGVKAFMKHLDILGASISKPKIAAVGSKTAEVIREYGLTVQTVPKEFTADSLARQLVQNETEGTSILLALGNLAKNEMEGQLRNAGCLTTRINVYQTMENKEVKEDLSRLIQEQNIDVVTFASPSAIDFFLSLTKHLDLNDFWNRAMVACIGKVSAEHAQKRGLLPRIVPNTYTAQSLVEAIADYYSGASTRKTPPRSSSLMGDNSR